MSLYHGVCSCGIFNVLCVRMRGSVPTRTVYSESLTATATWSLYDIHQRALFTYNVKKPYNPRSIPVLVPCHMSVCRIHDADLGQCHPSKLEGIASSETRKILPCGTLGACGSSVSPVTELICAFEPSYYGRQQAGTTSHSCFRVMVIIYKFRVNSRFTAKTNYEMIDTTTTSEWNRVAPRITGYSHITWTQ